MKFQQRRSHYKQLQELPKDLRAVIDRKAKGNPVFVEAIAQIPAGGRSCCLK
jgi:hypothetical protein